MQASQQGWLNCFKNLFYYSNARPVIVSHHNVGRKAKSVMGKTHGKPKVKGKRELTATPVQETKFRIWQSASASMSR